MNCTGSRFFCAPDGAHSAAITSARRLVDASLKAIFSAISRAHTRVLEPAATSVGASCAPPKTKKLCASTKRSTSARATSHTRHNSTLGVLQSDPRVLGIRRTHARPRTPSDTRAPFFYRIAASTRLQPAAARPHLAPRPIPASARKHDARPGAPPAQQQQQQQPVSAPSFGLGVQQRARCWRQNATQRRTAWRR